MTARAWIFIGFVFLAACSQGSSFDRDANFRFSPPAASLLGHCTVSQSTLVLTEGYCVEFYRGTALNDSPTGQCQSAAGTWAAGSCNQPADLIGRCYVKMGGDMNVVYFSGNSDGAGACAAGGSLWQPGTSF